MMSAVRTRPGTFATGGTAHRRILTSLATISAATSLLVGCRSAGTESSQVVTSTAPSTTRGSATTSGESGTSDTVPESTDPGDSRPVPCLPINDVAAVFGEVKGRSDNGGGVGGTAITYSYQGCSYRLADGGDVSVTRVVSADPLEGSIFETLETAAVSAYAENGLQPLADLGDDGYRVGGQVAVLRGPKMFTVSFSPTGEFGDDDPEQAATVAATVADLDLSGDPLDCAVVATAVEASGVGKSVDHEASGGATSIDDVQFEFDGCLVSLGGGGEVTVQVSESSQWEAWIAAEKTSAFTVAYQATTVGEHSAFDDGETLVVDDGAQPLRIHLDMAGTPAELANLRIELAEVAAGY